MSVQDDKTSPTPLRRKGSFKGKEETIPEPAPAPKRTSTVFGMCNLGIETLFGVYCQFVHVLWHATA